MAGSIEVLLQFVLAVNGYGATSRPLMHVDGMQAAAEADVDAVVYEPIPHHALAEADGVQQIHGALFEHARAYALDNVFLTARFQYDGVDTAEVKKVCEKQSGRPAANDCNLRMHASSSVQAA